MPSASASASAPQWRDQNAPRNRSDSSFLWSDARLLGYKPMADTHQEFYEVTFRLLTSDASNALAALAAFEEHAQSHFGQEEWLVNRNVLVLLCHKRRRRLTELQCGQCPRALASATLN